MVHVPKRFHLDAEAEKHEYDKHDNCVDDKGYRRFLGRMFDPLKEKLAKLPQSSHGLDFGCGPGPALAQMFRAEGHKVELYDHFYFPNREIFKISYDFISATEVVEHLSQPRQELERLWQCLKTGGLFGVMTKRVRDLEAFRRWHYKNDPTHICFFDDRSFEYLADQWQCQLELCGPDTLIFTKL
ncbi:class I SAM-dependent methyltransferase [Pseudomaricurvus alkylphenolicus]|uniref:class I SAM-dependent methyltransferase n=1 Tax=Pseudomaricurvus alkylphenolicus TaxID=1306991 RepID=UPI001F1098BB|nr:class I SAM-dependent methyltransferase [Pseudomaricurvus alkylphenolicus]